MTQEQIRYRILDLLTEDSYGLWELTGLPEGGPPIDELIDILDGMIRDGLVEVYGCSKSSSGERMLSEAEARRAIKDRAYWDWSAPANGDHIRAMATRAGDEWYYDHRS